MQGKELKTESAVLIEHIDGKRLLEELQGIRNEVTELTRKIEPSNQVKYITSKELCELAKISEPTRWKFTRNGIFKAYYFGTTVRYLESEVLAAIASMGKGGRES